jgi:hypothetical protein
MSQDGTELSPSSIVMGKRLSSLLLPLVPFWTHANAMMGARHLTCRHLRVLGFNPAPRNGHLASLFGVDLSSVQTGAASQPAGG